jgi:hypothetical protein
MTAVIENEKVFPVFTKYLSSSNLEHFKSYAIKGAKWLSSERAYYEQARPKVSNATASDVACSLVLTEGITQIIGLMEVHFYLSTRLDIGLTLEDEYT